METEELSQRVVLSYQTPSGDRRVSVEAVSMQPFVTLECKDRSGEATVQLPRRALLRLAGSAAAGIIAAAGRGDSGREGVSAEITVTSQHGPVSVHYRTVKRTPEHVAPERGPIDAEFERDTVVEAFLVMPPGSITGEAVGNQFAFAGYPFARYLDLVDEALERLPLDYDEDDERAPGLRRRRR